MPKEARWDDPDIVFASSTQDAHDVVIVSRLEIPDEEDPLILAVLNLYLLVISPSIVDETIYAGVYDGKKDRVCPRLP